MFRALLTGTLYDNPVQRKGKNGKYFTTFKLRTNDSSGATLWVSLIAFGEEGERIATMRDGAAIAVSGQATLKVFEGKQGHQASLNVTVDQVATLRAKPRPKREQQSEGDPFADLPGVDAL